MKTLDENIATHIYASFDRDLTGKPKFCLHLHMVLTLDMTAQHNGAFLTDCKVVPAEEIWSWGRDAVDAEKLWKISEDLVGQKFEY